jgi:hypothetical protein
MRRLGRHQRDELIAQVDKGLTLAATAQGEFENATIKGKRLLDVADFERDVIDADEAGQFGGHGGAPV